MLTGPLHELDDPAATDVVVDGVQYLRTPIKGRLAQAALRQRWPLLREREVVRLLRERLLEITGKYPVRHGLCPLAGTVRTCSSTSGSQTRPAVCLRDTRVLGRCRQPERQRCIRFAFSSDARTQTYVARNADAVAAIAKPMLDDLKARGIPANRLFHVPNGVDTGRFGPTSRDEPLALELDLIDRPVFGFFGSLYRYEGISWLIRAAAQLRLRGHKFSILIVGRGEDRPAIEDAIRGCNAASYVRSLDHVPHEQIARYYSVVDVTVYPRRSLRLTELVTPLKPLEAMALGKPVLASAVGGIRELVDDENTGLLFEPENISDFCRQAERMIVSPALRESLSQRGRDFVVRERDWGILAQRYRQIYDFVLQDRRSEPA